MLELIEDTVTDQTIIGKLNASMQSVATVMWSGSFRQLTWVL